MFKKKQHGTLFLSVRLHIDSSIHRSVENVLCVNQEHTLCSMNLPPDAFLEPAYIPVSKVWVNQPRVQDLADVKLTLLSGLPPRNI